MAVPDQPTPIKTHWCFWGQSHRLPATEWDGTGHYCPKHQAQADAIGKRNRDRAAARYDAEFARQEARRATQRAQSDREAAALARLIAAAEQCSHCAEAAHAYRVARGF